MPRVGVNLNSRVILRLAWSDRRLFTAAFLIEAFVLIIGAFAAGGLTAEKIIGGMVQAAAAWGNSGIYVDVPPGPTDVYTHVVLLPLSVFGGLGLVVVLQIYDLLMRGTPILRHTQIVLRMTAAL